MMPGAHYDASHLRLTRDEQIATARRDARLACEDQGHALGPWRSAGLVADDEARCVRCGDRLFLVYGSSGLQPMVGARVSGTALNRRCQPPLAGSRA